MKVRTKIIMILVSLMIMLMLVFPYRTYAYGQEGSGNPVLDDLENRLEDSKPDEPIKNPTDDILDDLENRLEDSKPDKPVKDPAESISSSIVNPDEYTPNTNQNTTKIVEIGNGIVGAIKVVGSIIAVLSLVIMGIKYMVGSIEAKAEYKKSMIPYIVGSVLLFASSQIVGILYDYFQRIGR